MKIGEREYYIQGLYGYWQVNMKYGQLAREGKNGCSDTGNKTIISGIKTKKEANAICVALTEAFNQGRTKS